jgi:uncharacterized protein with PQ loop repeat
MAQSKPTSTAAAPKAPRKSIIERLIYVAVIAEPIANVPQLNAIYSRHDASGVSIGSWALYACFALIWLWYGVHTKQKPMMIGGTLFFMTDMSVAIGASLYGGVL